MAESTAIIKAVVAQWNTSSVLRGYQFRSTRIDPTNVVFPSGLLTVTTISHSQYSGGQMGVYLVSIVIYCGTSKTLVDTISSALTALFSLNVGLPVLSTGCYVLSVVPVVENPELDKDDFYGEDVNVLAQQWRITTSEGRPPVNSTLAT